MDSEQVRWLLQNGWKVVERGKCLQCDGTGWINWDEWGDNERPGKSTSDDRECDECEKCRGVGFIW